MKTYSEDIPKGIQNFAHHTVEKIIFNCHSNMSVIKTMCPEEERIFLYGNKSIIEIDNFKKSRLGEILIDVLYYRKFEYSHVMVARGNYLLVYQDDTPLMQIQKILDSFKKPNWLTRIFKKIF